jgi:hypothetical protein
MAADTEAFRHFRIVDMSTRLAVIGDRSTAVDNRAAAALRALCSYEVLEDEPGSYETENERAVESIRGILAQRLNVDRHKKRKKRTSNWYEYLSQYS